MEGTSEASGSSPGLKSQPSFQNSAAGVSASTSFSFAAVTSSSKLMPASLATMCAGSAVLMRISQSA